MAMSADAAQFQAAHFDATTCKVVGATNRISGLLGFPLNALQIIQLCGAPSGSTITLTEKLAWTHAELPDGEQVPLGLLITVSNDAYLEEPNEFVIYLDGHINAASIYLKLIMFNDSHKGIAGHMVSLIAAAANATLPGGGTKLRLFAAGGRNWADMPPSAKASGTVRRWGGYVAWPKYGFDMALLPATGVMARDFPYYPAGVAGCPNVSDVIDLKGGPEYWRCVGDGDYMNFDLKAGSQSRVRLDAFMANWRPK